MGVAFDGSPRQHEFITSIRHCRHYIKQNHTKYFALPLFILADMRRGWCWGVVGLIKGCQGIIRDGFCGGVRVETDSIRR